jgi:uncharacterized protein YbjT (DUF2867 family)
MIVVTGPNGNVGTEFVKMLVGQSELAYKIAAHTPDKIRKLYGPHVPAVAFDYADRSTWDAALEGVTTLFLLFPLPHPRTAKTWMVPFVRRAAEMGCQHITYTSVPGADRLKYVPHYHVEKAIRESGVDYTILRAAYFSQNLIRDITTHAIDIAKYDELFIPAKKGKTTFLDSRDVAAVAVEVIRNRQRHAKKEYLLTGPDSLDFYEVADIMSEVLGRKIRYVDPGLPRFWWRMRKRGVTLDAIVFMTIVYNLTRAGMNNPLTSTVQDILGRPPTPMRAFITDYRRFFEPMAKDAKTEYAVKTPGFLGGRNRAKAV